MSKIPPLVVAHTNNNFPQTHRKSLAKLRCCLKYSRGSDIVICRCFLYSLWFLSEETVHVYAKKKVSREKELNKTWEPDYHHQAII